MGSQWSKDSAYRGRCERDTARRAAYKIIEIQNRHHIIRETDNVVDLGAAPGSWLQVIRGITREKVLGIDLSPIVPLEGVLTMVGDISDGQVRSEARALLGIVNVVTSDAAPKLSGHRSYDQARSIAAR